MAERKGFEPSRQFITVCALSRGVPSTTRPPLRPGPDRDKSRVGQGGLCDWGKKGREAGPEGRGNRSVCAPLAALRSISPPRAALQRRGLTRANRRHSAQLFPASVGVRAGGTPRPARFQSASARCTAGRARMVSRQRSTWGMPDTSSMCCSAPCDQSKIAISAME